MRAFDPEKARALLSEAGWKAGPDGILAKDGIRFKISMLTSSSDLRHYTVYLEDLKRLGIDASLEQMSHSSVRKRIDDHEFDLYWAAWGAGRLRDPEASWSSKTADEPSTSNIAGVKDAWVDSLIEAQKTELDLNKRNDLLRQLDARLNTLIPYVFLWGADHTRLLHWRRYGMPEFVLDKFNREDGILTYWYLDSEKSDRLEAAMAAGQSLEPDTSSIRYRGQ
jgi:microcin C transport system substrate-binding protein